MSDERHPAKPHDGVWSAAVLTAVMACCVVVRLMLPEPSNAAERALVAVHWPEWEAGYRDLRGFAVLAGGGVAFLVALVAMVVGADRGPLHRAGEAVTTAGGFMLFAALAWLFPTFTKWPAHPTCENYSMASFWILVIGSSGVMFFASGWRREGWGLAVLARAACLAATYGIIAFGVSTWGVLAYAVGVGCSLAAALAAAQRAT